MLSFSSAIGFLLVATTVSRLLWEWSFGSGFGWIADILACLTVLLLVFQVSWQRWIYAAIGAVLAAVSIQSRADWLDILAAAASSAAFIAAFFTALATLRNAAGTSKAIESCGRFLAQQPPGRRYAALTVGGQLFGMLLNYGSLVLLGSLAEANARLEPNAEIRGHRIRRMLLAIQRGFISTLTWSPLAFAVAISTSIIPGASWAEAVAPCLVSSAILVTMGWGLDTLFKPKLSVPVPARIAAEGSWLSLWPLLALLVLLIFLIGGLQLLTGVRAVGVVMLVVPVLSVLWIAAQNSSKDMLAQTLGQAGAYVRRELPGYRSEVLLLMMAGFIGTLGSKLLAPAVGGLGIDLAVLPAWLIPVSIVWLIPLTGQLGMNPILSVSLFAPLLPEAQAMGLRPVDLIVAITAGWALSGASSPYTATTLLIGALGKVSALHVGVVWNGVYTLLCAIALSGWVSLFSLI